MDDSRRYQDIKIACILDEFSYECFKDEGKFIPIGLKDWKEVLVKNRPDFLFVESAWQGNNGQWLDKITNLHVNKYYPELKKLIDWCKENKILTVFWGKEDPYDFDVFIEAAKYFDFIFTTDENCVSKYKDIVGHSNVFVLPFAAQPKIHNPIFKNKFRLGRVAFAGGWYDKKLGDTNLGNRKENISMLLKPAFKYDLHIYDRFYSNKNIKNRFPKEFSPYVRQNLSYKEIIQVYKKYDVFLNVNSVQESPTNFSRRVFELLACGTPIISSYSLGIEKLFSNIVKLCKTEKDTETYLKRLLSDKELRDRLSLLGQREVFNHHTYQHRLERILDNINMDYIRKKMPGVSIITCTKRPEYIQRVFDNYAGQRYPKKEMVIILNNNSMKIEIWKRKAEQYNNIKVFQLDEKIPLGSCLNFAIEQSNFEIISKFDDDDYYGPEYLTDSVNAFKYTNAAVVGKYTVYAYLEDKKLLVLRYPDKENRYMTYVSGSTLTFKKEIFNRVKFRNQSISEDTNFLNEVIKNGYKVYATDKFNHVICRRSSLNDHSWKISEDEFLKKCKIIVNTDNYKKYVTV